MGIEIAIRFKIEMLARRVFKQDGELWEPEEIKKHWQEEALKYAMTKEPFEVSVVIDNKHLPYGYDEAATYEPLFVSGFIEPQLSKVQGPPSSGCDENLTFSRRVRKNWRDIYFLMFTRPGHFFL